jgi:hypothetical protein
MDSDLEAFSHYPSEGSFAALSCQTASVAANMSYGHQVEANTPIRHSAEQPENEN